MKNQIDTYSRLIRHADRDEIKNGSIGNEVLINDIGKKNSILYGESLSGEKISKIYTSPIQRCIQTAEFIAEGYGKKIDIVEDIHLGNPGLHVTDSKLLGDFIKIYGMYEVYSRFVRQEFVPGILETKQIYNKMKGFLMNNSVSEQTTIFITHDLVVGLFHYSIDKRIYHKDKWINFLEGITFKNGILQE